MSETQELGRGSGCSIREMHPNAGSGSPEADWGADMAHTHALRAISQLSPRIRLDRPVEKLAREYKAAKPFPHIVIDNLVDDQLLKQLVREMPPLHDSKYMNYDDGHLTRYKLSRSISITRGPSRSVEFLGRVR